MIQENKQYSLEINIDIGRDRNIDSKVNILYFQRNLYFLIEVNNKRFLKICLNEEGGQLAYFETYQDYVDFNYIEKIILKINTEIKNNFIKLKEQSINKKTIETFDLISQLYSIEKNELTFCFSDERYNYTDGIKHINFYSSICCQDNEKNLEHMLFLIKYNNKYEYCIMDTNLNKIVKFVFEKNINNNKFYLIRKENYVERAKHILFKDLNREFTHTGNTQEGRITDLDVPSRHGACGFHFYHFFSISDYFEEMKVH